jgi:hypothetical protein
MRTAFFLLASSVLCLAVARDAGAAKPPAYTVRAGFHTALRNVSEREHDEECLDAAPVNASAANAAKGTPTPAPHATNEAGACQERGGVLVAEGTSTRGAVSVTVKIREIRHKRDASAHDLEMLAHKMLARPASEHQVRMVTGTAGGRPAVEQWSVKSRCGRSLFGRVLVSLPDKVIEVEATASAPLEDKSIAEGIKQVSQILHGVRVRRLGDMTIDPAPEAPDEDELTDAVFNACM